MQKHDMSGLFEFLGEILGEGHADSEDKCSNCAAKHDCPLRENKDNEAAEDNVELETERLTPSEITAYSKLEDQVTKLNSIEASYREAKNMYMAARNSLVNNRNTFWDNVRAEHKMAGNGFYIDSENMLVSNKEIKESEEAAE